MTNIVALLAYREGFRSREEFEQWLGPDDGVYFEQEYPTESQFLESQVECCQRKRED